MESYGNQKLVVAHLSQRLSIVLFDLGNFKRQNDTLENFASDEVLNAISDVLSCARRSMNLVARFGGDEFLVVLSNTLREGVRQCSGLVPEGVSYHPSVGSAGITLSAGVAVFYEETDSSNELIRAADEYMYRSKADKSSK